MKRISDMGILRGLLKFMGYVNSGNGKRGRNIDPTATVKNTYKVPQSRTKVNKGNKKNKSQQWYESNKDKYVRYRDPRTGKIGYIKKNDAQLTSKSGSYGDHGNIFQTWGKYLTSNERKVEKQIADYQKRKRQSNLRKTSQDKFQQKQYKKQVQSEQNSANTMNGGQLQEVIVTAKRPTRKTQTASRQNSHNTPTRKRPVRRVQREEQLPLLNNPNYVDDASTRGIRFIPQTPDNYYDIEGKTPSQQLMAAADARDKAYAALAQQMLDAPVVSNMDQPYNEFAAPDEYNRGKVGYWW